MSAEDPYNEETLSRDMEKGSQMIKVLFESRVDKIKKGLVIDWSVHKAAWESPYQEAIHLSVKMGCDPAVLQEKLERATAAQQELNDALDVEIVNLRGSLYWMLRNMENVR